MNRTLYSILTDKLFMSRYGNKIIDTTVNDLFIVVTNQSGRDRPNKRYKVIILITTKFEKNIHTYTHTKYKFRSKKKPITLYSTNVRLYK